MNRVDITETELHAFIDGQLDDVRAQHVAGLLEADPELRACTERYRADREMLCQVYAPLIEEKLPPRLVRLLAQPAPPRQTIGPWFAAAGFAAAAAALLIAWLDTGTALGDPLLAEAIAVRDGAVAPERRLEATLTADARDAALAKALDVTVSVPDLGGSGYKLAGAAIYPDRARGHAVELDYRNGDGRLLTVYLHRPTGAERYEVLPQPSGKHACISETAELSAVMIGEMSEQEMLRTAQLAYSALKI